MYRPEPEFELPLLSGLKKEVSTTLIQLRIFDEITGTRDMDWLLQEFFEEHEDLREDIKPTIWVMSHMDIEQKGQYYRWIDKLPDTIITPPGPRTFRKRLLETITPRQLHHSDLVVKAATLREQLLKKNPGTFVHRHFNEINPMCGWASFCLLSGWIGIEADED